MNAATSATNHDRIIFPTPSYPLQNMCLARDQNRGTVTKGDVLENLRELSAKEQRYLNNSDTKQLRSRIQSRAQ